MSKKRRLPKAEPDRYASQVNNPPKTGCTCRNHLDRPKIQYKSWDDAFKALMQRHLRHGGHRIVKCRTSNRWHIVSQKTPREGQ